MKSMKFVMIVLISLFIGGCTSTITARPGGETGIPYYLPKPYLLITKNIAPLVEKTTEKKDDKGNSRGIVRKEEPVRINNEKGDYYFFQIVYLPDLTQKYGLEIQSRTGTIKTNVTLIDGWKLVGINLDADAKTSDIIKAVGELIPSIPKSMGIEKGMRAVEEIKVGLWLYEIKVEKGQLKYDLAIKWTQN